jgi:CTP:molybdopterin cytidylyltransferase MocA
VISAVVLAAGAGARLGGPKALVTLAGVPFVERVVRTCAESTADEVVVVTGEEGERVESLVAALAAALPGAVVRSVRNQAWREGRTGSVQAGLRTVAEGAHVLLFPVDHPCVRLVTLDALLGVFGYAAALPEIVVPVLQDAGGSRRRGHPIVLSAGLRGEILALAPDRPLHEVVHAHVVLEVPVDDDGVALDVDDADALARAERLLADRAPSSGGIP